MPRQLWETGQATSVEDLNLAMTQTCRIYRTTAEAEATIPIGQRPRTGQIRIITGLDLPTRERSTGQFIFQYYNGSLWLDALIT